ncbi:X-ray radiation resistance-associated protein 1 [Hemicordylus capensis]|uniref:X-ray radiation resistance-associated protein 1 n=1 Tax=Hemicordylus capensis TaxID=884348 RepID=UPI0023020689|nr:X-ray radiation resistance-associated protein 1 [Hemicordylus capensis]
MATKGMYKLDDGNCYPTNCFPARSLLQPKYQEGAGHWQVARQTAEKTKIELLFGTKVTQVKWREPEQSSKAHKQMDEKTLDGVQLMTLHHVRSPSHLCSVDISNQNFTSAKEEDFEQFDSVAYINGTENLLTLEVFRNFPGLRELELSLNGLRNLQVYAEDFPHLEVLDLSYNNLSPEDVRILGVLSHLKALHLTANGLHSLPLDLAVPESEGCLRFPVLEVLLLDDNHLSHPNVFVSLANLQSLKQLNLDKNGIKEVPYLHHVGSSCFSIHPLSAKSGIRAGLRSRKSASKRLRKDGPAGLIKQPDYIVIENRKDPDRTEVIFPAPEPSTEEHSPCPRVASKVSSTSSNPEFTPPLPELRFLSLANNQIEHEEDLLAVALFPSLTELTFYGNPFTISRSGDPPLLTSFLQNKLEIKLVRKKISKLEKPRIFIPVKANRMVKSQLPKVRKHPPLLEAPHGITLWQLWTGRELDPDKRLSLDEPEPLPPIGLLSEKRPSGPLLPVGSPLPEEDSYESMSVSLASSFSEEDVLGIAAETQPSRDEFLFGHMPSVQSSAEQVLFVTESLPPRESFLAEQSRSEPAALTGSFSVEQDLSKPLPQVGLPSQEECPSEPGPLIETASAGEDPSERPQPVTLPSAEWNQSEPVPSPHSPLPEQDPEELVPKTAPPAAEQDISDILPLVSSPSEQDQEQPAPPPSPPLQEQALSEPDASSGSPPSGNQDLAEPLLPVRSTSEEQNLLEPTCPPTGSPTVGEEQLEPIPPPDQLEAAPSLHLSSPSQGYVSPRVSSGTNLLTIRPPEEEQDQLESAALPHSSPPQAQDLAEPIPPTRSPAEEQDLPETVPPIGSPSAEQAQLEPVPSPSSPLQEQMEPGAVPSTRPLAEEQDLTQSLPPAAKLTSPPAKPPPEKQALLQPISSPTVTSKEPTIKPPSGQRTFPSHSLPARLYSMDGPLMVDKSPIARKVSSELLLPSRSTSGDLYKLIAQSSQTSGLLSKHPSEAGVFSSSGESVEERASESIFITQVDEASRSQLEKESSSLKQPSKKKRRKIQQLPEKYKGYEKLLDGVLANDPDFLEPVGIQQNVKALRSALQHPLVYRESKARLDSLQKPFVPMEKKVLRVRAPQPQETKVQKLEEILLKMRTPTNILEVPLARVLQRKESNWREYQEALVLLEEFRKDYQAAVATCDEASEARTVSKQPTRAGKKSQS